MVFFENDIESAILASPNGKAPELDGARNEMMKADIKLTTRLVFWDMGSVWKAWIDPDTVEEGKTSSYIQRR